MKKMLIWMFVVIIFLGEIVLRKSAVFGFCVYIFLISGALFILSAKDIDKNSEAVVLIFLIVPLVRISGLFLDVGFFWKIGIEYSILLFMSVYYLMEFNVDVFKKFEKFWMLPFLAVVAFVLGSLGGRLVEMKDLAFISIIPLIAFSENLFFRGLLQNIVEDNYGVLYSLIIGSFLYGLFSLYFGIYFALLAFVVGLFLSSVYLFSRNIFLCAFFDIVFLIFVLTV